MGNEWVDDVLKPDEWCIRKGFRITDPAGWRQPVALGDNYYPPQDWYTPIGEEEFEARAAVSTIGSMAKGGPGLKLRPGDQQLPTPGIGKPVQDLIIDEMAESKRIGGERYGSAGLYAFNGRRGLRDAREEARDLLVYMTQVMAEADATKEEVVSALTQHFSGKGENYWMDEEFASRVVEFLLGWIAAQRQTPSDATIEEAAQRLADDDGIGTEYSKQEWDQYIRTARVVYGRKPN